MDKVGADVVLLHGCPQSCTPKPVEGLLEVNGDMTEVFNDSDNVGADVVFLHGCPQSCMQTLSKAFLESMKTW